LVAQSSLIVEVAKVKYMVTLSSIQTFIILFFYINLMKKWVNFHYPKLALLAIAIIFAYAIFHLPSVSSYIAGLENFSYLGIFLAGICIAFGFTAPFAVGLIIVANPSNLFLAIFLGALGAMLGDILIFYFVRLSFMDEFKRLERTPTIKEFDYLMEHELGHKLKIYMMYIFADIIIASPLPDELGMAMLAGLTKIKPFYLGLMSFSLHLIGMTILLLI
jgi:uncharacterized membrane protein YdjX (TVP38/TMEM64 family)